MRRDAMDWNRILELALAGAVFGLFVSVGRWLHVRLLPRVGAPAALALVLGVALVASYGVYRSPLAAGYRERLAVQRGDQRVVRIGEDAMKPVLASPEFQRRIQGLDAEQVRDLSMQLAAQGQLRLSDAQLVRRMQLLGEALEQSEELACGMSLIATSPVQLRQVLNALPDASLREWMELSAAATLATLRESPAHAPDPEQAQRALGTVLAAMTPQDRERVAMAIGNPAQLAVPDACWTARTLYRTAVKLPPDDAALVARVLAMQ
jgi:hypothetical protein